MKIAIIGSRGIKSLDLEKYLPDNISLIISGGARGVDRLAEEYAKKHKLPKLIFLPDYKTFGQIAPLIRNKNIANEADEIYAFWDGLSSGTMHTINYAKSIGKQTRVFVIN